MRTLLLFAMIAVAGCSEGTAPSAPQVVRGFVQVNPSTRLEYVDFGGRGPAVVLLAGLGNTAHVFESFAGRLTDRYHVYAITRRGFGASSQPASGYDTPSLARDVRVVLDSLRLTRVHLIGHSVAGDELTRFATDYPDRVTRLVYLDGAYDRVALGALIDAHPFPDAPAPALSDIVSAQSFGRYISRIRGVALPNAEIRATYAFAANGGVVGEVTPTEVYSQLFAGIEAPHYERVQAPALAIYAVPQDAADVLPWLTPSSSDWPSAQNLIMNTYAPFYRAARAQFAAAAPNGRVIELTGANHYVFISDASRVAQEIRSFLGTSQ